MNISISFAIVTGILLVSTFISGFFLSGGGKPYGTLLFTVHKLLPFAAAVFSGIKAKNLYKAGILPGVCIPFLFAGGVFILLTIVTGGMLSVPRELPPDRFKVRINRVLFICYTAV